MRRYEYFWLWNTWFWLFSCCIIKYFSIMSSKLYIWLFSRQTFSYNVLHIFKSLQLRWSFHVHLLTYLVLRMLMYDQSVMISIFSIDISRFIWLIQKKVTSANRNAIKLFSPPKANLIFMLRRLTGVLTYILHFEMESFSQRKSKHRLRVRYTVEISENLQAPHEFLKIILLWKLKSE